MAKKLKNKQKEGNKKQKFSSILTPRQKEQYRMFGRPDMNQNWLELFNADLIRDLHTIMTSCSDNQKKSDYVSEELSQYGFQDVGIGTNITVMANPVYPGVVFKIALDECGVADNFNDCILSEVVPHYTQVFARDASAIVSVQRRRVLMTPDQMILFNPRILKVLKELSKYYLVADLSPTNFLNYGITEDGDFEFIDASDLYPLHQIKDDIRCKRIVGEHKKTGELKYCEGKLKYTDDFMYLECEKCGRRVMPLELRPRKDVQVMQKILSDGMSKDEINQQTAQEIAAVQAKHHLVPEEVPEPVVRSFDQLTKSDECDQRADPVTIFVHPEADDDEEEADEQTSEDKQTLDDTEESDHEESVLGTSGSGNESAEGQPDMAPSATDDADEAEGSQGTAEADEVDDGFVHLERRNPRVESQRSATNNEETDQGTTAVPKILRIETNTTCIDEDGNITLPDSVEDHVNVGDLVITNLGEIFMVAQINADEDPIVQYTQLVPASENHEFESMDSNDETERQVEASDKKSVNLENAIYTMDLDQLATQVSNVLLKLKNSRDTELIGLFNTIIDRVNPAVGKNEAVTKADAEAQDGEDIDGNTRKVNELTTALRDLNALESPYILDIINHKIESTGIQLVEIDQENKNNEDDTSESKLNPYIRYRVINDADGLNSTTVPGIYMNIHGDPAEAYDESGLPIYISLDNGTTCYKAINAYQLKAMIDGAIKDAKADMELMATPGLDSEDSRSDDDDEDEEEEAGPSLD